MEIMGIADDDDLDDYITIRERRRQQQQVQKKREEFERGRILEQKNQNEKISEEFLKGYDDYSSIVFLSISARSGTSILEEIDYLSTKLGTNPEFTRPGNKQWQLVC